MTNTSWLCAAIASIAIGCTAQGTGTDEVTQPGGDGSGSSAPSANGGAGSGSGSTVTGNCAARTQPPGSILLESTIVGGAQVITDANNNVIYTTNPGIVKLDVNGNRVFALSFGDIVTTDAAGDIYVAGMLGAQITLGGTTYDPVNGNVLIVELSPAGDVLYPTQDLCNANMLPGATSLLSIAVSADGRIALSGTTFGVVVLDRGLLAFQIPFAGHVAFDATGNLVLGFAFGGSGQFELAPGVVLQGSADYGSTAIVRYDVAGAYVSHYELAQASLVDLAIDASGDIAFDASFFPSMDLYGVTLAAPGELPFPEGTASGAIAVRLDSSFNVLWAMPINPFNLNVAGIGGLAVNAFGDVLVSSNLPTSSGPPYAFPTLTQYSASAGGVLLSEGARANGFGLGVAEDTCGNIYFASVQYTPSATTLLQKIVAER